MNLEKQMVFQASRLIRVLRLTSAIFDHMCTTTVGRVNWLQNHYFIAHIPSSYL